MTKDSVARQDGPHRRDAWLEHARRQWDERAAGWDASASDAALGDDRARELDWVVSALGLQPGQTLLDAGCGTGQWAIAFAQAGLRVTAIDLAPEMIRRARDHAAEAGVDVNWLIGDLTCLTEAAGVFDAVQARVSLQFAPDVPAALAAFRAVLKPGGRLLVTAPGALSPIYRRSWQRHLPDAPPGVNWVTATELEPLLLHLGWRILDERGEFGDSFSGATNPLDPAMLAGLPPALRRAAATTWTFIAT